MRAIRPIVILILLLLVAACPAAAADPRRAPPVPLPHAHAHNDYRHARPLLDALDQGFCSVEADIFLVDGQLLVGHDRLELRPERTLQALYLDPLRERVKAHGGRVYRDGPEFTLLVDLKTDGPATYRVLRGVLAGYRDILTRVEQARLHARAVRVILSGNRPQEMIAADSPRYAAIDGRLGDLDSKRPADLMPLLSDDWRSHFSWRGFGTIPDAEAQKLRRIVDKTHAAGRRVRFWNLPENPALWSQLRRAGVDLINTDDLPRLREFFASEG